MRRRHAGGMGGMPACSRGSAPSSMNERRAPGARRPGPSSSIMRRLRRRRLSRPGCARCAMSASIIVLRLLSSADCCAARAEAGEVGLGRLHCLLERRTGHAHAARVLGQESLHHRLRQYSCSPSITRPVGAPDVSAAPVSAQRSAASGVRRSEQCSRPPRESRAVVIDRDHVARVRQPQELALARTRPRPRSRCASSGCAVASSSRARRGSAPRTRGSRRAHRRWRRMQLAARSRAASRRGSDGARARPCRGCRSRAACADRASAHGGAAAASQRMPQPQRCPDHGERVDALLGRQRQREESARARGRPRTTRAWRRAQRSSAARAGVEPLGVAYARQLLGLRS